MIREGDWRPGMPSDISALILGLMTFQAMNRGLDYVTGDKENTTASLTVVEQAMPLWAWGIGFCLGGLLVAVGMWRRRADPIVWGSVLLMSMYAALAWGLMLKMVERGTSFRAFWHELAELDVPGTITAWPWDGWRTPCGLIITAVLWACFGWGTRVMQRARGDS